eukprot:185462_1
MTSPPGRYADDNDTNHSTMLTNEGLPLCGASSTNANTDGGGCGGPARRIECRPHQLVSTPSLQSAKASPAPTFDTRQTSTLTLTLGLNESSLIDDDDDDDEFMNYFGSARSGILLNSPTAANSMPSSTHWDVGNHSVPTLPSFYPLDMSATFVLQVSASTLAARISSVLQARSIVTSFDSQNAKADCISKSQVEFRIRLYHGRVEYRHGIIVEVQRRWGFDSSYQRDVYAILDAAEGKNIEACDDEVQTMSTQNQPCYGP